MSVRLSVCLSVRLSVCLSLSIDLICIHKKCYIRDSVLQDDLDQDPDLDSTLPAIPELGATLRGAAVAMTRDAQRIIR